MQLTTPPELELGPRIILRRLPASLVLDNLLAKDKHEFNLLCGRVYNDILPSINDEFKLNSDLELDTLKDFL